MNKVNIYKRFSDLILEIKEEEYLSTESGVVLYKAKILLKGNYFLRIKEIWDDKELIKYSYYFLDDENNLIIGWDNAPHHLQVKSFLHHKHVKRQDNILMSNVNC
ncbi:MAG: toxin-antitoxin system TumE family protein [bacterium]